MRITLLSDSAIRFEPTAGEMTIKAATPGEEYSPFHMMAVALAYCTFSVMYVWANQAGLSANDLTFEVAWTFADNPHRVGTYDVRFAWPSLPAKRLAAAERVAQACAVHATLQHPPRITTEGTVATPESANTPAA